MRKSRTVIKSSGLCEQQTPRMNEAWLREDWLHGTNLEALASPVLLGLFFAAEHDDLTRANVFDDFELLQQALERVDLLAVSGDLDNHRSSGHVHGVGVEVVAKLQNTRPRY